MIPNKWIIIWNGKPIGVDTDKYPFKTENPNLVKYWNSEKEAKEYSNAHYPEEYIWFIHEIQFRIMEEKQ